MDLRNSLKLPETLKFAYAVFSLEIAFFRYVFSSLELDELLGLYPKLFLEKRDLSTYRVWVVFFNCFFLGLSLSGWVEYFLVKAFSKPLELEVFLVLGGYGSMCTG